MPLSNNESHSFPSAATPSLFFKTSNATFSPPWEEKIEKRESLQPWLRNRTQLFSDLALFGHSDQCHMSPVLTAFLILWYGVTMVLGLLGNIYLICIITRRKEKANVTGIFICNLSFSDILVCVFCLPFTVIYTIMDHWVFGSLLCRLVPFIQCVSVTVSILSLVFIALERHQLIVNPAGWKPTITQAYIALVLIWILACFTSSPFLAFQLLTNDPYTNMMPIPAQQRSLHYQTSPQDYLKDSPSHTSYTRKNTSVPPASYHAPSSYTPTSPHMEACLEHWPSPQHRLIYTTWLLLFQYCGPLLLVLLCYVRVFVRLRHRKDMLDRARAPECQRMAHSRRINIMLVALITAFAVCWLPLTIFNVVSDWDQDALPICNHNLLFSLCHLLAMSSTCINPVIYGFLNSNFRQEVKDALLHCRCSPVEEECEHFPMSAVNMETSRTSMLPSCKSNSV